MQLCAKRAGPGETPQEAGRRPNRSRRKPALRSFLDPSAPFDSDHQPGVPLMVDESSWIGVRGRLPASARRSVARLAPWQQRTAIAILCQHLGQPIAMETIARRCGVTRSHFISAFGSSVGVTPYQWLISRRLSRARELLASTDMSLVEIALDCGFYDQSHFSRSFVRWMGIPPGKWRHGVAARTESQGPQLDGS